MTFATRAKLSILSTLLIAGLPGLAQTAAPAKSPNRKIVVTKAMAKPAARLAAPVKVTSVEGITEYHLANGLRVLMFPDPSKATVTVNVTYLVGSRHENYGETGMAHLLEHLVFKGTPNHKDIPKELTEHGARPNGSTWLDRTNYFETFQSSDENLKWALDLESDRMVNSFIAKKDLDSEMTVVRNEFESGENNPIGVLQERVMSTAYLWHNYGKSTIGAKSDLENVNIERLQAFYHNYYQPDNAVLLVAGKFDEPKTLGMINERFGRIAKPARAIQKTYTLDPTQDGERSVTLRRTGDVQVVAAVYHTPSGGDSDAPALDVLSQVLADTPSGRLHKALVETKKASFVFGDNATYFEPGVISFFAQVPKTGNLDEAKDILLKTVEEFTKNPATQEEVDRAKTSQLKQYELILNQSDRLGLGLSEYMAAGDWRLFFLQRDRIRKVTTVAVRNAAEKYLKASNRTLGLFIPTAAPERAEIPAPTSVAELVKDYKGQAAVAQGEAFDASPANIDARTTHFSTPAGLKVALLPKKTRGGSVQASLTLRLGSEDALMNKGASGSLAGSMLMRGTSKLSRTEIKDQFDKLKARVSLSGGNETATASVETTNENLPAVLRLLGQVLRDPAFPASEFETLRSEQIDGLEQQRSEPTFQGSMAIQTHMNAFPKGHPRHVDSIDESLAEIKAAKLDDVKAFYKTFYGASSGELALVGDFDAKAIQSLVNETLGDWKSPAPFTRIADRIAKVEVINKSIETPDKANAFFLAAMPLAIKDTDADYPAMVLGNFMLGGGFLNSRLATRIRQKEGLSYGVGSQFRAGAQDAVGGFFAYAIYNPGNVAKLEAAFMEEMGKAVKDGFTEEEIKAAKSGWLQSQQVSRSQDRELASRLAGNMFNGRTMAFSTDLEKKVGELTADQILASMRKFLDPVKLNIVKAGDFAKANKK
ncbi:MAG: insulinase family protein [Holophagaceae bacterium]|nr:insulinase family protein [Holophagaceae bacterium]